MAKLDLLTASRVTRRAHAQGMRIGKIQEAIRKASWTFQERAHQLPPNPRLDMNVEEGVGTRDAYSGVTGCEVKSSGDVRSPKEGDTLAISWDYGDGGWSFRFDGKWWRHTGEVDHRFAAEVQRDITCKGYYLYSGIRRDVAALCGYEYGNGFQWAFDEAVKSFI